MLQDSDLADPQSWNKYAYVRNNPLRYVDPTGQKAEVTLVTDEKNGTGTISVRATIALWTDHDGVVTKQQMAEAQEIIESQIKNAYRGNFEKDGITFSVNVSVTATVYSSEKEAIESGAMNVIKITAGDALPGVASSIVDPHRAGKKYDTGVWSIKDILRADGAVPAHEFVHLLGVPNQNAPNHLATGYEDQRSPYASYDDYHSIFDQSIIRHRDESRLPNPVPLAIMNRAPAANGFTKPRNHTSKRVLRA